MEFFSSVISIKSKHVPIGIVVVESLAAFWSPVVERFHCTPMNHSLLLFFFFYPAGAQPSGRVWCPYLHYFQKNTTTMVAFKSFIHMIFPPSRKPW